MYNAFYTTHKAKLFIKKCEESKLRSLRKRKMTLSLLFPQIKYYQSLQLHQ